MLLATEVDVWRPGAPAFSRNSEIIELEQVEDCSRAGKVSRGQMEETSSPGAVGASVIFIH